MILTKVPIQENGERIIFSTSKAEIIEWLYAKNDSIFYFTPHRKTNLREVSLMAVGVVPFSLPFRSEVAQSRLYSPMDCSLSGSSVHGIFQARVLQWVAISFSRESSRPVDWTQVSHIAGRRFTLWTTTWIAMKKNHCIAGHLRDPFMCVPESEWTGTERRPWSEGSGGGANSGRGGYGREGRSWFTGNQRRRRLKAVSGWVALVTSCSLQREITEKKKKRRKKREITVTRAGGYGRELHW